MQIYIKIRFFYINLQGNFQIYIINNEKNSMKTRFFIAIAILGGCIALASCGGDSKKQPEKKEKKVDPKVEKFNKEVKAAIAKDSVNISAGDNGLKAEKNGQAFTGEVWSLDGKSYVMKFKDGLPDGSITYHKNGKMAINAGPDGKTTYYDEEEKAMEEKDFLAKYEKYLDEIGEQMESVFARMDIK